MTPEITKNTKIYVINAYGKHASHPRKFKSNQNIFILIWALETSEARCAVAFSSMLRSNEDSDPALVFIASLRRRNAKLTYNKENYDLL